jgi:hypothetical protein
MIVMSMAHRIEETPMSDVSTEETSWWDQATDAVADTYDAAAETVEQTYDSTAQAVEQAFDYGAETVEQAYDYGAETVEQAYDYGAETVEQAYDTTVQAVEQAWETASGAGDGWSGVDTTDQFAADLRAGRYVRRDGRPPEVLITNADPEVRRACEANGFVRVSDNPERWVHPETGDEVYLIPSTDGQPDDAPPDGDDPTCAPVVDEAREWADFLGQRANGLPNELAQCEAGVGEPGYSERYQDLMASWNQLDSDLLAARSLVDGWRQQACEDDAVALEAQIDRIEQAREWRDGYSSEFFSRAGALPQP